MWPVWEMKDGPLVAFSDFFFLNKDAYLRTVLTIIMQTSVEYFQEKMEL